MNVKVNAEIPNDKRDRFIRILMDSAKRQQDLAIRLDKTGPTEITSEELNIVRHAAAPIVVETTKEIIASFVLGHNITENPGYKELLELNALFVQSKV